MSGAGDRGSHGHRARKRFGQHFLTDPQIITDIVAAVAPRPDDVIVEIGPGTGAITGPLAASGATLIALEFDRDLAADLTRRFADQDNVQIVEADALSFDFAALAETAGARLRVVGNLPYNISTPLMFHLVGFRHCIRDMHFMLQKEVVDRLAAGPGSKRYGRLSIAIGCTLRVMPLFDVPPGSFSPPPKVDSAVIAMQPLGADEIRVDDPEAFSALLAAAFAKRRKTLRNALKGHAAECDLEAADIDPGKRPEDVDAEHWAALANLLARQSAAAADTDDVK